MQDKAEETEGQPGIPLDALDPDSIAEIAQDMLMNGKTFGELHGLTQEQMEVIYSAAYNAYEAGSYDQAHKMFQFLSFYQHLEQKYWLGLGACRQMLKQYDDAIASYAYATLLDSSDPRPPLMAADCHLALGNREGAISALTAALYWSENRPEHRDIHERASSLLRMIDPPSEGESPSETQ